MYFKNNKFPLYERKNLGNIEWFIRQGCNEDTVRNIMSSFLKGKHFVRKVSGKREIQRVLESGESYFVKQLHTKGIISKSISLFRSKGMHEFSTNQTLYELGIPVPYCVAFGRERTYRITNREYILTKDITNSRTLIDYYVNIFNNLPRREQKGIIREFAMFIKDLHNKGILHSDLHAGNILVQSKDGKTIFYLLDLYGVKTKSCLNLKERYRNLALLNMNFFTTLDNSLRYYFFKQYANGIIYDRERLSSIKKIETTSLHLAVNLWYKRQKRCLRNNNSFSYRKDKGTKMYSKKGWGPIQSVLLSPERFFSDYRKMLKNGRTVTLAKVNMETGAPLFLKRYNNKGIGYILKNLLRSSRAKKVWKNSYSFEMRGLPTPAALAYREERKWRILKRSYIISEFIIGGIPFNKFIEGWENRSYNDKKKIMIILGKLIQRMHFVGCFHGDLKWNNILIKEHNSHYDYYLTDLDGSKVKKWLKYRERVKDVGRFYVELEKHKIDTGLRDSFLRAYYCKDHIAVSQKIFLHDITIRAEKLLKRKKKL